MGYTPRHSIKKIVDRLSWTARISIAGGSAIGVTLLGAAVLPGAGSAVTASCSNPCTQQQIGEPSGYNLDVDAQTPAEGKALIVYGANVADPAQDFTVVPAAGNASLYQILYTPYGVKSDVPSSNPYGDAAAYDSNGNPVFAVSSVSDQTGVHVQLRYRATSANTWQDFKAVAGQDGHTLWEPNFTGTPMALNDSGYGKNFSPIVMWPASTSDWNESWYPGANIKGGAVKTPPPANQSSATTSITNDPDSGYTGGTGHDWAIDKISRDVTLNNNGPANPADCGTTATTCFYFTGSLKDTGTFAAPDNNPSPRDGTPIDGPVNGNLTGTGSYSFYASANADSSLVASSVDDHSADATGNNTLGDWYRQFFPTGTTFSTDNSSSGPYALQDNWDYSYTTTSPCVSPAQNWVDSYADGGGKNSTGDITGAPACAS